MLKNKTIKSVDRSKYLPETLLVIFLNFIGIIICVYFILELNLIKIINVSGNKEVPAQEIINASGLKVNDNVWRVIFYRNDIKSKVKKELPQINQYSISFKKFNETNIEVSEYGVVGYLQVKDQFHSVLANGSVDFHLKSKIHQNRPIFNNFKTKDEIKKISQVYQKIPLPVRNNISEIKLTHSKVNPNQITLNMSDGNLVIGDLTTIDQKISDYSFYTKGKKGKLIIDLEVGSFVKMVE